MFHKKRKKKNIIPRLLVLSFITIACVQALSSVLAFTSPEFAYALDDYTLQTQIGDTETIEFKKGEYTTAPIAEYIKIIYKYAIGVVGIVAAVVLMIGGVLWLTAGGNATQVGEAKAWIGSSMIGLVLVLTSYLILSQINTDLVNLKITDIKSIPNIETATQSFPNCQWFVNPDSELKKPGCPPETIPDGPFVIGIKITTFKDWEYEADNNGYCGSNPFEEGNSSCCCKKTDYSFNEWPCQTNICTQKKDASQDLKDLLKCLGDNLPKDSFIAISSISDSQISSEKKTWEECRTKGCAHSINSCHYGGEPAKDGGVVDASFAVDLVGDKKIIIEAANKCKNYIKYMKNESSHIHLSTPECLSDGKNY